MNPSTHTDNIPMQIHLDENDLAKMPNHLSEGILNFWLQKQTQAHKPNISPSTPTQLTLVAPQRGKPSKAPTSDNKPNAHIRLSELFAAGIIHQGMNVRVKLINRLAKARQYKYLTGLKISDRGTVLCESEEFDKVSPLAAKVNQTTLNGWEYVEVFTDGKWIGLDKLRKILRAAS